MSFALRTSRLTLAMPSEADYSFLRALYADPEIVRFNGGTLSEERAAGSIAKHKAHWDERGYGLTVASLTETGERVGFVSLTHLGLCGPELPDLGFVILPKHQSKGFATEASAALVKFGFETLGVARITAGVSGKNEAAVVVLRRLGFQFVENRDFILADGRDFSGSSVWALTRAEVR
jgi:[ribosomal protein S5]-alanine N-acetyltransferase